MWEFLIDLGAPPIAFGVIIFMFFKYCFSKKIKQRIWGLVSWGILFFSFNAVGIVNEISPELITNPNFDYSMQAMLYLGLFLVLGMYGIRYSFFIKKALKLFIISNKY